MPSASGMMGMEAVYLVHVGEMEDAQTQFDHFVNHQIDIGARPKIVVHASRMIGAIDESPESDQSEARWLLNQNAVTVAINALRELDEDVGFDDSKVDELLSSPELSPLKATEAFQVWSGGRR